MKRLETMFVLAALMIGVAVLGGGCESRDRSLGTGACKAIDMLDRSCTGDADCVPVTHVANCCGTSRVIGIRAADQATFGQLEPQCDASYPACGCGTGPTTTDDGSTIAFNAQAGVTCLQGKCTTFVPECAHPCAAGTTCFSCVTHNAVFAGCTTTCTGNTDCKDSSLPLCQDGLSSTYPGKYCTATGVACGTK